MRFVEKQVIENPCYSLKATENNVFYIDGNSFCVEDREGKLVKKYSVSHPSHFYSCNESLTAIVDTSGQLYIADGDSLIKVKNNNKDEGPSPVCFNNRVYCADWGGRIFCCDLNGKKLDVIADFSKDRLMLRHIDIDEAEEKLFVTAYDRKSEKTFLLHSDLNEIGFQSVELPFKKRSICSGVVSENGRLYCCNLKSSSVYAFELTGEELKTVKALKIPERFTDGIENISVYKGMLAVQNRDWVAVVDMNSEDIIFDFSDDYLSSVDINNGILCIGSWKKGYLFNIVK